MWYLSAIVYGVVQGVAEFLPISSSGHLVLLHQFMAVPFKNELAFDITLHLATLVAVLWYFRETILELAIDFWTSLRNIPKSLGRPSWLVIYGTLPAALVGVVAGDEIEHYFGQPLTVAFMLVAVGVMFIVIENHSTKNRNFQSLTVIDSVIIGLSQVLALLPGTSRSGITVITGLGRGLSREASVKYSFLLSLTVIAGASILKVPVLFSSDFSQQEIGFLATAFISAGLSGLWAVSFLMRYVKANTLKPFAYYRFALAAVIIIWSLVAR